jgi:hypothetical protein
MHVELQHLFAPKHSESTAQAFPFFIFAISVGTGQRPSFFSEN